MIVDCFTYAGEAEMLRYRLVVLAGTVDRHVLVEANQTFSGEPKELHFQIAERRQRQHRALDTPTNTRIHSLAVCDMPSGPDPWVREHHQRNLIDEPLHWIDLVDDDLIFIGDADEIPDPAALRDVSSRGPGCWTLVLDGYFWDVEHAVEECSAPKVVTFSVYRDRYGRSPQRVREDGSVPRVERAGWHLSYFGDPAWIARKTRTFSHHLELGHLAQDESKLEERHRTGWDPFGIGRTTYLPLAENPRPPPRLDLLPRMTLT